MLFERIFFQKNNKGKLKSKAKTPKSISKVKRNYIQAQKLSSRNANKSKKRAERKKRGLIRKKHKEDEKAAANEKVENSNPEEQIDAEDVNDMIESEDVSFMKKYAGNKAYSLLRGIKL